MNHLFDANSTRLFFPYPPQVNPPCDPQPSPDTSELLIPSGDKDMTNEIFLCVSVLAHEGQGGSRSASEKRTIFSKDFPH
jgi:hypothetical protein